MFCEERGRGNKYLGRETKKKTVTQKTTVYGLYSTLLYNIGQAYQRVGQISEPTNIYQSRRLIGRGSHTLANLVNILHHNRQWYTKDKSNLYSFIDGCGT